MIGTRGVPAEYGGFETAVEEVGSRLAARGHHVTVYCREAVADGATYLGIHLVGRPLLRGKFSETLSHAALSVMHRDAKAADVAVLFNAANSPLLPVLRRHGVPTALHVDGLEWMRSKWGRVGRRYYRSCERLAVRWADALIADARGIQEYYRDAHDTQTELISYGAAIRDAPTPAELAPLSLLPGGYHLVVARFEPENNVHLALRGYLDSGATLPLVVVGSARYGGQYEKTLRELADSATGVRLAGPVWDQDLLSAMYAGALTYVHGHSVGGTNPSLLRAMGGGAAPLAFDVSFNREVAQDGGRYWRTPGELAQLLAEAEDHPRTTRERGRAGQARVAENYTWDHVADEYESLLQRLADRRTIR
jgi:glycosyltransferase involved in cell wall biosynthesis